MKPFLFSTIMNDAGVDGSTNGGGATILAGAAADKSTNPEPQQGQGQGMGQWYDSLNPELQKRVSKFQSVEALAMSYTGLESRQGKRLEAPGEKSAPEEVAAWKKLVGAPDKPEAYYQGDSKSFRPDVIPEDAWDGQAEKTVLEWGVKNHVPAAAMKELMDWYGGHVGSQLTGAEAAHKQSLETAVSDLKKEWGDNFDRNLTGAARIAQAVGLDPEADAIFQNPVVVKAFARMAELTGETKLITSGSNVGLASSNKERASDIQDPKSTSIPAREYRGEFGPERQAAAQSTLHKLLAA